jgi:hypothetical protein
MTELPAEIPEPRYVVVPADKAPERTGIVSFMSSTTRNGRWAVPRHMRLAAVFGNIELDLRDAEISEGITVWSAPATDLPEISSCGCLGASTPRPTPPSFEFAGPRISPMSRPRFARPPCGSVSLPGT